MPVKIEASELRTMSIEEIKSTLKACQEEYQRFLQQKHTHTAEREDVTLAKKNIARCKCVLHEKSIQELVDEYKGKKFIPKQLRPKMNKALRMKLTPAQSSRITRSQRIHKAKYPQKIFSFSE